MSIKIKFQSKPNYAEESQPNPLQWAIVSAESDGSFLQQSAWIICKDFFNDLAYSIQLGKHFRIYGFNAGEMKPPAKNDYVYMIVRKFTDTWMDNVDKVNDYLKSRGYPGVNLSNVDKENILLEWHPWFFENTYRISLMSLVIRLCNYGIKFNSWEDIVNCKTFPQRDQEKWNPVVKKGIFFDLPEYMNKFVWYYNDTTNSECAIEDYRIPGLVHNCGVLSWTNGMK
jgi:hypothetical protein